MLLASLASIALAAGCPSNLANELRPQPAGSQLITVEATSTKSTYATLRTWRRSGGCWVAVGRPYPARVGRNGIRKNRREGDGTTPIGTFRIGRVMYGNEPNPGVKFRYQRLRCGDWWNEDPSSPTYNTLVRPISALPRQGRAPLAGDDGVPPLRGDRVQHAPGRPGPRLGDLPARADRPPDERLHQSPPRRSRPRAALALTER